MPWQLGKPTVSLVVWTGTERGDPDDFSCYSALVTSYLSPTSSFGAPDCKENIDQLKRVQWKDTKALVLEGDIEGVGLVQPEEMASGHPNSSPSVPVRRSSGRRSCIVHSSVW